MLKARDVRAALLTKGMEKGTVYCLETLAEQQSHMMKRLVELAQYFDKMVETMNNVTAVGGAMKNELDRLKSIGNEDDLDPNTENLDPSRSQ